MRDHWAKSYDLPLHFKNVVSTRILGRPFDGGAVTLRAGALRAVGHNVGTGFAQRISQHGIPAVDR